MTKLPLMSLKFNLNHVIYSMRRNPKTEKEERKSKKAWTKLYHLDPLVLVCTTPHETNLCVTKQTRLDKHFFFGINPLVSRGRGPPVIQSSAER
jgi:hypothetical protein